VDKPLLPGLAKAIDHQGDHEIVGQFLKKIYK
jgi:hypothetical protein